jgi:hypothetical protein
VTSKSFEMLGSADVQMCDDGWCMMPPTTDGATVIDDATPPTPVSTITS